jgi:N-methylhydantoinase B
MIEQKTGPTHQPIDGVTVEVIRNYLVSAAEEMRATLMRTAFNPVIYDVLDFGISIYDKNLDLIAEAPGLTSFLGANDYSIVKGVEHVGAENIKPGDVLLMNYPYWNSAHTYDATLFSGVFEEGGASPQAFLCVRAHWIDLGAKDPGYVLDSTDMHQEGLIFPGTRIFKEGKADPEWIELLRFNSRMPDILIGDLNAMVASLRTGERRVQQILERFGREQVEAAVAAFLDHAERVTRKAIEALPHGSWTAVDWLDDDGITPDPIKMQVTVTVKDSSVEVDFSGSSSAVRGPVNMPFGASIALAKVFLKSITTPDEPGNAGHSRPLVVKAEPGNLFHAVYPSATFTLWTGIVALELLFKAAAQGMPGLVSASSGGDVPGFMMLGIHPDTGRPFALSNNDPVGWGGTDSHDGCDATIHMSESIVRNTPVEVLETRTTMLFDCVEMRTDSGGPGRWRGGVGIKRDIRFLTDGEFLSVAKKTKTRPWALAGGTEPEPNAFVLFPGTAKEKSVGTNRTPVQAGEHVFNLTAGGGGYGDPFLREPERVREDVLDGLVSREQAAQAYGVVLDAENNILGLTDERRARM